jgi:hypothetical protein
VSNSRKVIRLVRPYDTEADFIRAEGWTIGKRGIIAIEQPDLAPGTAVRVDVNLRSGAALIRAEGTVEAAVLPEGTRPSGLRIKFTRMSPDTQQFLRRAAGTESTKGPTSSPDNERAASDTRAAPAPDALPPEASRVQSSESQQPAQPGVRRAPSTPMGDDATRARLASLGGRSVRSVPAPETRDELLDRLRARAAQQRSHAG